MQLNIKVLSLFLLLLLPIMAIAQDEIPDPTPRQILLDAFESTLSIGHHIEFEFEYTQYYLEEDEADNFEINMMQSGSGDFNANGDHHIIIILSSKVIEPDEPITSVQIERLQVDEVNYINFTPDGPSDDFDMFGLTPGWWLESAILDEYDEFSVERLGLEQLFNSRIPGQETLRPALIRRVTEAEPETLNGIEMRVFDVELNPLAVLLSESYVTSLQDTALQSAQAVAMSLMADLEYHQRYWIGAEDGLLYKGTTEYHTYLPYRSMLNQTIGYDIETMGSSMFTITDHFQEFSIIAPANSEISD